MIRVNRLFIAVVYCGLGLVGGMAWWASGAGATVHAAAIPTTPQPYGVNFTFHTFSDPNYCLDDSPRTQGNVGKIGQCAANDNQHWKAAHTTAGSFVLVDGLGHCLGTPPTGKIVIQLTNCTFAANEHFYDNSETGQVQNTPGTLRLQAAAATQNASVFFEKCQVNPTLHTSLQVWQIGH